jgi:hypothetical protein
MSTRVDSSVGDPNMSPTGGRAKIPAIAGGAGKEK